jgi:GAF domain-containing protein
VLERIVESCGRLFAGRIVGLNRVDDADGMLRLGVYHGPGREDLQQIYPLPLEPTSGSAIAILEHRVVHYPDVEGDDVPPATKIGCRAIGIKSVLFAPLLWQARALGAIYVGRDLVRPFSEREIALLETFADQAAIAIQNGRLFNEVTRRNADLAEALAQQTATAEILHVISSSPSDVQPVFDAIAERAIALCNARIGGVARYDGELVHLVSFKAPQAADGILRRFPMKPSRASITARAIFEAKTVQVPDILEDPDYALVAESLAAGFRANLAVPMIRNGEVIGSIGVCREERGLFPDKQVRLLQTFADQAVIAIENVRLFNETRDALERQTATAEILRVISSSPTSTIPVFEAIAAAARNLCHATTANVVTFDGTLLHLAARSIVRADGPDTAHEVFPRLIGDDTAAGRAILSGRIAMIPDVLEDALYAARHVAQARRSRSFLGVPLLRDGTPIGAIVVGRPEVGPFPDKQISLLQTFADQAVIAIENVRLFNETTEALEQQTATADILRVMSGSPTSTQPVFEAILESSARLCEADMGLVLRYENGAFHTIATLVPDPAFDEYLREPIVAGPLTGLGRVARTKAAVHIPDLVDDIAYRERDPLRMRSVELGGVRTWLGMPMLRDGELIGVIAIYRKEVRPFEPRQIEVLRTFADQAVIAIENVRLFNATQEALETQTATTEVLRVISQSPTDVQPVFEAIAERAKVLCGAVISGVARYDGEWVHLVAYNGISAETDAAMRAAFPMRPGRRSILGWAVAQRAPVQIPDVLTDADYGIKAPAQEAGFRSNLAVPMIKDGEVIGAIGVGRPDAGLFPDRLVQLLQTFADQAVIAIENTRLFNETQEALQTQTATADILKVISESPTDVQPVFDAIAERAKVLCNAIVTGVFTFDGEWVNLVAYHGISAPADIEMRRSFPMRPSGQSIAAKAIRDRAPVQIADVLAEPSYGIKEAARQAGYRSNLGVPMLKEGQVVGSIVVCRGEPGVFPEQQIRLLQTFADQAVIAIENVRLFNELREKSEQLERASRHKSEFLANMSHELRTPLNAIIGFTRIVMRRSQEAIEAKQYENLEKILQSGQNLLALINSILDLAKVEAGRVEIHPGDVTLAPLLADCARTIEPLLDESAVKLLRDFDAAPTTLFTDEEKLRQIVINLLSNAAKFTPQGTITIAAMQRDDAVTIAVRDTGIGIPADKLELVFEEFEQAGRTGADMQRGTGLGLTISRRLARLMGGDITATSTLGAGSTFTLTLPLRYGGPP